jgi:hypothetical protein
MGFWASDTNTSSPFTGKFFKMTTFCIAFYKSYLSTLSLYANTARTGRGQF